MFHESQEQQFRTELGKDVSILRDHAAGGVPLTLQTFRERVEAQPSLFDEDDWGGCGCFADEGEAS